MSLTRIITVIAICLVLQACTAGRMSQEVQRGKASFAAGNFKQAFHELLPLAADGEPQAEYAVGYMYYYGYGVSQDSDSGLFWMKRAASQHYMPALRALGLIAPQDVKHEVLPDDAPVQTQPEPEKKIEPVQKSENTPHDEVLEVLQHRQVAIAPHVLEKPLLGLKAQQSGYTLQLLGSYKIAPVKDLRAEMDLRGPMYCYHTYNKTRDWYVLTYGHYATVKEAKQALKKFPQEWRELKPWIRKVDSGLRIVVT